MREVSHNKKNCISIGSRICLVPGQHILCHINLHFLQWMTKKWQRKPYMAVSNITTKCKRKKGRRFPSCRLPVTNHTPKTKPRFVVSGQRTNIGHFYTKSLETFDSEARSVDILFLLQLNIYFFRMSNVKAMFNPSESCFLRPVIMESIYAGYEHNKFW